MERGARWTLAVVGAAVGFGFGLAHLVWRASSCYPDYAGGPFRAYGSRAEPRRGWPAAPPAAYPAWGGAPEAAYAPRWAERGGWGAGYPPVHPSAEHPSWAGRDPAAWWAPDRQDGPPPPSLEDSPPRAATVAAPETMDRPWPPAPDRPPHEPVVTAPE